MPNLSHPSTLRRRVSGVALIIAPLVGLAASQIWPDNPPNPAARLAGIAEESGRHRAANLLTVLAIVLFLAAILAMLHLLRERKPRFAHVGGALALVGIVGWSGTTGITTIESEMANAPDRAAMVALAERIQSSVGAGVFLAMFLLGLFIGLIVLAVGLWRARVAPFWMPLLVVAAIVLDVAASTEQIAVAFVWILLTLALGWLGMTVLRMSDDDWERSQTPTAAGNRPPIAEPTPHF